MSSLDTSLIFIVNGEDVPVTISILAPLSAARTAALRISCNNYRSYSDWQIRNESGHLLDVDRTIGSYNFAPNTRFFLTLAIGIGGSVPLDSPTLRA